MKRLPLYLWLLLSAGAAAVIAGAPPPLSDLTQFLPDGVTREQRLLLDQIREGPGAGLILLEIAGGDTGRLVRASRALAERLRQSSHFRQVLNGQAVIDPQTLQRLLDYRYLLLPGAADLLRPAALRRELENRLQELTAVVGVPDKRYLPSDPVAAVRRLLARWRQPGAPAQTDGVWLSRDGARALLMLSSRYPVFDLDRQAQAVAAVGSAFSALPESADLTLRMSGPPVFAVESRRSIENEVRILGLLAGGGTALMLLLVLRSPRLLLLAALPLASGILAGAAGVILLFGQIHGITLAFGITLIGVADDYPIHLFTHATSEGGSDEAIPGVWPIMRLGVITTGLGFSALLFSHFGGLSQLGTFAIIGLVAAAAVTRFVLPLLAKGSNRNSLEPVAAALFGRLRLPWLPVLVVALAAVVLPWKGERLWEHDLARLSPVSAEARAMDTLMRGELGAPDTARLLLITGTTAEEVLERSERLEPLLEAQIAAGGLAGFDLPSRYVPSHQTQQQRRDALPEVTTLRRDLAEALLGLPFRSGLFEPFVQAVGRSRTLPSLTPGQLQETPLGLRVDTILGQHGDTWVGLATLSGIRNASAIEQLAAAAGEGVTYLDLALESSRLVADYRNESLRLSALGAVAILLVLSIALRDPRLIARVTAPVLAAVLGSAAILSISGQQLSVFHIAALLLVLGIGTDYGLFIALTPADSPRFAATAASLLACALTTLLVFGLLAASSVPVLSAIGLTVFSGTLLSLLLSAAMVHTQAPDPA